jgi:nucleoid DNA-binding protein
MNFKELTEKVAEREGGKVEINIAQIKEIVKITLQEIVKEFKEHPFDTIKFLRKYK